MSLMGADEAAARLVGAVGEVRPGGELDAQLDELVAQPVGPRRSGKRRRLIGDRRFLGRRRLVGDVVQFRGDAG